MGPSLFCDSTVVLTLSVFQRLSYLLFFSNCQNDVALRYRRVRGLYFLAVVFAATTIIHFARDCGRLVRSTARRAGFAFGVSVENYKDW